MSKKLHSKDIKALIDAEMAQNEANRQKTGTGNPLPPGEPGDFNGMAVIRLRVADVEPYEDNPRQALNPQFDEIKDSIRARGLDQRLIVTKRPGAQRYILAKGGKTRLKALQELALEDPARFERIDFELVKYVSESELLVAHMVENVQHATMTFWDTAAGFLLLRSKRIKELQRSVSDTEFAEELKKLGFKLDRQALGDYTFLHETIGKGLASIAQQLTRNDLRKVLRPQFNILAELMEKLNPALAADFLGNYQQWLSQYADALCEKRDQDTISFDAEALALYVGESAANALGITAEDLAIAQAALAKDRKIDGAGLRAAIAAAAQASTTTTTAQLTESPHSPTVTSTDLSGGHSAQGLDEAPNGSGMGNSAGSDDGQGDGGSGDGDDEFVPFDSDLDDAAGQGPQGPRPTGPAGSSGRVPDGLSGVQGVPKSLVHTLIPLDANGKPINKDTSAAPGTEPQGVQGTLPGTTSVEQAASEFQIAVQSLCEFAGIYDLLREAPAMPMTFFMEAPERPLGEHPMDYTILVWWFLVTFSGQFVQEHYHATYEKDGQTYYVLPDTGPTGWRQLLSDEAKFLAFTKSHLAGAYYADASFMLNLLSAPANAMAELAREVINTAATWRALRGG